jgi:hypothetical protein
MTSWFWRLVSPRYGTAPQPPTCSTCRFWDTSEAGRIGGGGTCRVFSYNPHRWRGYADTPQPFAFVRPVAPSDGYFLQTLATFGCNQHEGKRDAA